MKSLLARIGPLDNLDSPLWTLRLCPVAAALSFLLAVTLPRTLLLSGILCGHTICQLAILSIQMWKVPAVQLRTPSHATDSLINAVWTLRIFPVLCAALIALSMVYPTGFIHGFALGLCAGLFTALACTAYTTESVSPTHRRDPRDLQQLHLNS